ncbi:MAG: MoaD/ThiS family protein [Chloroflexi bacterium]|nr:MoaD/ThiS family protein [Chloroflexota bacterium]
MVIKYYATLRDITRTKEETWQSPTPTLQDLLNALCNKYGSTFQKWVSCENGGYGCLSIFLINGQDYRSLNGLQTQLNQTDIISIFPPIAGG